MSSLARRPENDKDEDPPPTIVPIAFRWPSAIPSTSPWRKMDVAKLVKTVTDNIAGLEWFLDDFFNSNYSVTRPAVEAFQESADQFAEGLQDAYFYLADFRGPDGEPDRKPDVTSIARLFPGGKLPANAVGPIPQDLTASILSAVFKATYRTLRRIVVEVASTRLRAAWDCVDPLGLDIGEPIPPRLLQRTRAFNETYGSVWVSAVDLLRVMATEARPVRRRLGDDPVFLDALVLGTVSCHLFIEIACQGTVINQGMFAASSIWSPMELLNSICVETNRCWIRHSDKLQGAGYFPPLYVFRIHAANYLNVLKRQREVVQPDTVIARGLLAELGRQRHQFEWFYRVMGWRIPILLTAMELNSAEIEKGYLWAGNLADWCDWCAKAAPWWPPGSAAGTATSTMDSTGSPTKFKRCGRCRVARYCSISCQTEAWKNGHRQMCFDAGSLIWA